MPAKESSRQSSLDAGLDWMTIGDFRTIERDYEAAVAHDRERPPEAQRSDDSKRAPITTSSATWKSDTRRWDYPGVDTPTDSPSVLPKDHMSGGDPRVVRGGKGSFGEVPIDPLGSEELARETTKLEFSAMDVPLSLEEDLEGMHAYSERAIGGFRPRFPRGGEPEPPRERDRADREMVPPDIQRGDVPRENDELRDDITYVFEERGLARSGLGLHEFGARVRRKRRHMADLADDFAAAELVARDLEDDR